MLTFTTLPTLLLLPLLSLPLTTHAQTPDGAIVPFSTLPTCAAKCGPLFDVQGACAPPAQNQVNQNCFCTDTRLTPFLTGNANVQSVCGPQSCSADADLTAIRNWYTGFCKNGGSSGGTATTTGANGGSTATGGSGGTQPTSGSGSSSGSSGSNPNANPPTWYVLYYPFLSLSSSHFLKNTKN